jgi:hypothetical protein
LRLMFSLRARREMFTQMQEGQKTALRNRQAQGRKIRVDTLKAAQRIELHRLAGQFQEDQAMMNKRHSAEIGAQKDAWRKLAIDRKQIWAEYTKEFGQEESAARSATSTGFNGASSGKASEPPSPAPPEQGWRARRSATERKADGTYRPRSRDPGRSRRRRPE